VTSWQAPTGPSDPGSASRRRWPCRHGCGSREAKFLDRFSGTRCAARGCVPFGLHAPHEAFRLIDRSKTWKATLPAASGDGLPPGASTSDAVHGIRCSVETRSYVHTSPRSRIAVKGVGQSLVVPKGRGEVDQPSSSLLSPISSRWTRGVRPFLHFGPRDLRYRSRVVVRTCARPHLREVLRVDEQDTS
jgi:hypothetical protein